MIVGKEITKIVLTGAVFCAAAGAITVILVGLIVWGVSK